MTATSNETTNWAAVGAQDAARKTYASIVRALRAHPNLSEDKVEIFLQGSYANDTNIKFDSDIDVVVMLPNTFVSDLSNLNIVERHLQRSYVTPAVYTAAHLRRDVLQALNKHYDPSLVEEKNKCIKVKKRDGYLDADVVPAIQYRLYQRFANSPGEYIEGTTLIPKTGGSITNYPKVHYKNGVLKNRYCNELYKPTVRQLKNLKRHAVQQGLINPKDAPGYLLECLVYNVPSELFENHAHTRLSYVLAWLNLDEVDFAPFKSVDGVHYLFKTDPGRFSPTIAKNIAYLLNSQVDWSR